MSTEEPVPADRPAEAVAAELFSAHRSLLFTVAYEMLGSVADAEDVVQESWLRWADVDHPAVRDPRAYLVRIVTRQSLNRLRTLQRRREEYVGPWLPEPLRTTADVADDVELADSVSFAMLVVLETLSPLERAVFVLRDVFGYSFAEIAEATERSPSAVRQLASRARAHVADRRRREAAGAVGDAAVAEAQERFIAAVAGGDLQALMDTLAPDVVLLTDGGGKRSAALRPIHGADKVSRFLLAVRPPMESVGLEVALVNGGPAILAEVDGVLDFVASVVIEDGLITEIFALRNPDKFTSLGDVRQLKR